MDSEVVIVGGGPFGLMLAIELGRRNVTTLLYDAKNGTAYNPQANATQARTMEYFCLLYTSPSPRDRQKSRMPSSA